MDKLSNEFGGNIQQKSADEEGSTDKNMTTSAFINVHSKNLAMKLSDSLENTEQNPNIGDDIDENYFSESKLRSGSPKYPADVSFNSPSRLQNKFYNWTVTNSGSPTKRRVADVMALESELKRSTNDKATIDFLKNVIVNLDSKIKV